ncbi:uncharacterized protein LOC126840189 [Adelges cooleyi]|uniref:uncharacterized protein LOC126840189 n=1 Tax=Adelges cooleyi TaxID=133065 RepID=UPI0021806E6E|nr:uncharacterized protein LOC126840189 [Adelges cooleyi]
MKSNITRIGLVLLTVYFFGLFISLNSSPSGEDDSSKKAPQSIINYTKNIASKIAPVLKKLKRSLSGNTLPRSVSNLRNNADSKNVITSVIDGGFLNSCFASKLDRDVTRVALEARSLILEGKVDEGRNALFKITKTKIVNHQQNKYETMYDNTDMFDKDINEVINLFETDVKAGK